MNRNIGKRWTMALAACLALAAPGFAQLNYGDKPGARVGEPGVGVSYYAQFYPLARFTATGGGSGFFTDGLLYSFDVGFAFPKNDSALLLGGWFWNHGGNRLLEGHVKYFLPGSPVGLQIGALESGGRGGSRGGGGSDLDAFVVYNLDSQTFGRNAPRTWSATLGVGVYAFNGRNTRPTGFVQGNFPIAPNTHFVASYWIIDDRVGSLDRLAVGFGYRF